MAAPEEDEEAQERQPFDTNAEILPSKRVKADKVPEPEEDEKMSKRKKRKLEQLAAKRSSQEMRGQVLKDLQSIKLTKEQSALLLASQSTRKSRREQVALAKQRVALGLPLTAEQRKLKRSRPRAVGEAPEEDDESGEGTGQAVGSVSASSSRAAAPATAPAAAEAGSVAATAKAATAAAAAAAAKATAEVVAAAAAAREKAEADAKLTPQPLKRVEVQRLEAIETQREKLPAVMMEQELVEMTLSTDVLLVCGETGCGKSTQVPQFLYEAGLCNGGELLIGVTQPRRVAAISVSQRVGEELNDLRAVGYQVRYDKSNCSKETRIKFMTDGILLREVQADFLCKRYSVIIIDEAHERGVNCDILIGLLSRAVQRRRRDFEAAVASGLYDKARSCSERGEGPPAVPPPPLKLIIMSATLRVCDFTENAQLFPTPPPVMRIEARTFPVTAHFAKYTDEDYIKAAHKTVLKIHGKLPPGTILVFVTGRNEVHRLVKLLNERPRPRDEAESEAEDDEAEVETYGRLEASDDEGGEFDDDLGPDTKAQNGTEMQGDGDAKRKTGTKGKKRKRSAAAETPGEAAQEAVAPASSEAVPPAERSEAPAGRKKNKGDGASSQPLADDVRKATKQKKKTKGVAASAGAATVADAAIGEEELDVDYGLGEEEDVVVLDPEVSENKKDDAAAHAKKVRMSKLDKSRTAGGAFTGIGFGEGPIRALPLYAQLPSSLQLAPFGRPPEGERLVVVATNVAETSVTLPNVRYVVDTGHEKRRQYRASSGISAFSIDRISKASADQRAGRAGRLGPGHAYRLYSSPVYENHFHQFAPIPILHTPLDPVLLLLAFLGVPRLDVFPWPTPPPAESVVAAGRRLRALGAVVDDGDTTAAAAAGRAAVRCTKLGFRLATLPVAPRYGKMLLSAIEASQDMEVGIVGHACAIVAALSVGNLTAWESLGGLADDVGKPTQGENELVRAQRDARQRLLDAKKKEEAPRWSALRDDAEGLLWLMGGYAWAVCSGEEAAEAFCKANRVNFRNIGEAHSLMQQLAELLTRRLALDAVRSGLELPLRPKPPTKAQALKLRECLVDGLLDRIAVQCPDHGPHAYLCGDVGKEIPVFIHSASNVHRYRPRPTVLAFNEIISTTKPCMRDCIAIDGVVLARRAAAGDCPLLQIGDFLPVPAPRYLPDQDTVMAFCSPVYSPLGYKLPTIEISVPSNMIFRYKVFAKALLEGEVLSNFPPKGARLLAQPGMVLHAPTNVRVSGVVSPLWTSRVGSRAELAKKWETEPRFLLDGLLKWLPPGLHDEICIAWPPALSGKKKG